MSFMAIQTHVFVVLILYWMIPTEINACTCSCDKLLRSARRSLQTFLFLFCFFFFLLRSADKVGRPFCFCSVFSFFFIILFYFSLPPTCVSRFLRYFLTNLDEIWHVDSPWWDEQTEYFYKSIGPGVGIRRGPKVLLCFIIRNNSLYCA